MPETDRQLLSLGEFLQLANRAGLAITQEDLEELARRKLLRSWEPPSSRTPEEHFHRLHLYVLARYLMAVKHARHPWGVAQPEIDLRVIAQEARECRDLVDLLMRAPEPQSTDEHPPEQTRALIVEWAEALRSRARELNPLGPFAPLALLLNDEARETINGDGLLFLAFRQLAEALSNLLTDPIFAPQTLPDQAEEPRQQEVAEERQEIDDLDADLALEPEALAEVSSAGFTRDQSQITIQTLDLKDRLNPLLEDDRQDELRRSAELQMIPEAPQKSQRALPPAEQGAGGEESAPQATPDKPAASDAPDELTPPADELAEESAPIELKEADIVEPAQPQDTPAPTPEELSRSGRAARAEKLNQQRQTYLAERRWEELSVLYENNLDLFDDPDELQQVFLTLALLYELKLARPAEAFERFSEAWEVDAGSEGKQKAFDGMQRLGAQPALHQRWVEFLESALLAPQLDEGSAHPSSRANLQRKLALALHDAGEDQRAFFTYTAFLADVEPELIDAQALDDLEKLASRMDADALADFYADLLSYTLPDAIFEPLARRAARYHTERGEVGLAMEYYERILLRLPENEIAFLSLSQLYEDSARWIPLRALYQARIAREGEQAAGHLFSELKRIEEQIDAQS